MTTWTSKILVRLGERVTDESKAMDVDIFKIHSSVALYRAYGLSPEDLALDLYGRKGLHWKDFKGVGADGRLTTFTRCALVRGIVPWVSFATVSDDWSVVEIVEDHECRVFEQERRAHEDAQNYDAYFKNLGKD